MGFCFIVLEGQTNFISLLTLLHSEQSKLHRVLAVLCAIGLNKSNSGIYYMGSFYMGGKMGTCLTANLLQ